MRKLSLLLALFALPLLADSGKFIFRDGDVSYGHFDGNERAELGRHYAYFERDGVGYVIHEPKVLEQLRRITAPQAELGRQQAALGAKQAALGAKQAALGAEQAAIGLQQARAGSGPDASRLGAQQRELGRKQQILAEQQGPLGEQQRVLGEKQREASRGAREKFEKVFDEAIRTGVAKRR